MERLLTFKGIIKAFLKSYNTLLDKVEVYDEKEALLIENNVEKVYDIFKMTPRSALLFSDQLIMENQFCLYFPLII